MQGACVMSFVFRPAALPCTLSRVACTLSRVACTLQLRSLDDADLFSLEQVAGTHSPSPRWVVAGMAQAPSMARHRVHTQCCQPSPALPACHSATQVGPASADWTIDPLEDVHDNPRWRPFLAHLINEPSEGEQHPNVEWRENLDVGLDWQLICCCRDCSRHLQY